jgi:hypothetical protein
MEHYAGIDVSSESGYLDIRYLAALCGVAPEALQSRWAPVNVMHLAGELAFVDNMIVATPASLFPSWPVAVERVLAAIPAGSPVPYPSIREKIGETLSEISVQTVIQRLRDTGQITAATPGGTADWSSMTFARSPS